LKAEAATLRADRGEKQVFGENEVDDRHSRYQTSRRPLLQIRR
jgi:hypothetical protein